MKAASISTKKSKAKANSDKEEVKPVQTPVVVAAAVTSVAEDKANDKKNNSNKSKKENGVKHTEESKKEITPVATTTPIISADDDVEGLGLDEKKLHINVERAAKSILEVIKRKKEDSKGKERGKLSLLDDADDEVGETIFVGFSLITMPEMGRLHGNNILLPHSFRKENTSVCLFVKDKEKARQSLIDGVASGKMQEIKGLEKILSLKKLETKFKEYQSRRDLKKKYDVFIADDSIAGKIPGALGKIFYGSPKRPLVATFCEKDALREDAASIIENTLRSTTFYITRRYCPVRVGNASMKVADLVDNIKKVILDSVDHIVPNGWKNVKSIIIEGEGTLKLPIYSAPAVVIAKTQSSSAKRSREDEKENGSEKKSESATKKQKNSKNKNTNKSNNNTESKAESDVKSDNKDDKMEEDKPITPSTNGKEKSISEAPKSEKKDNVQSTKKSKSVVELKKEEEKEEEAEKDKVEKAEPSAKKGKKAAKKDAEVVKTETVPAKTPSKKEIEKSESNSSKTPKSVIKSESKKKTKA